MAVRAPLVVAVLLLAGAGLLVGVALPGVSADVSHSDHVESVDAPTGLSSADPIGQQAPVELSDHKSGSQPQQQAASQELKLPTGERVRPHDGSNETSVEVVDGNLTVIDAADTTYAFPDDRDPALDRSLFDIEALQQLDADEPLPVLLRTDASPAALDGPGVETIRQLNATNAVAATVDTATTSAAIDRLRRHSDVERIALDHGLDQPAGFAVDEGDSEGKFADEGSRSPTDQLSAASPTDGNKPDGDSVTVAVVDTGIDDTHPDLEARVVNRIDLLDDGREGDPHGHGTAVAGVIAGEGVADERGYEGVAPGVDLIDVRAMDAGGSGQPSLVIEAIERVVEDTDADVLVLSTAAGTRPELTETTAWAVDQGVAVVTAAGNSGTPRSIDGTGAATDAITVGATDHETGRIANFSSRGPTLDGRLKPDVVARGTAVPVPSSTQATNRTYQRMTGTSFAAPLVGGVVARMLADDPSLDPETIRHRIASTATPVSGATVFEQGGGRVNPEQAVDPDIVVDPATVSLGGKDSSREQTLTVRNHDSVAHDLSFEPELTVVDGAVAGPPPNADAIELNETSLALDPGEQAAIELRVPELPAGTYSLTLSYRVDGERRTVAVGIVDGGEVTIERETLDTGETDPDAGEVLAFAEDGSHEEIISFENDTASFFAAGGTYTLWSTRTDDESGATILTTDRQTFDGPTTVVLDERETVPVGPDLGGLQWKFGSLTAYTKSVSVTDTAGNNRVRWDVSHQRADSPTVRATPDTESELGIGMVLVPDRMAPTRSPLAASDVFHVVWGTDHVTGERPYVSSASLSSTRVEYGRQRADEELQVQYRADPEDARLRQQRRDWSLAGSNRQRIHRYGDTADYELRVTGAAGTAVATPTAETAMTGLRLPVPSSTAVRGGQPYHAGLGIEQQRDGPVLEATPMRDAGDTALDATNGTADLEVTVEGEQQNASLTWPRETIPLENVTAGDEVQVSLSATAPAATLSTQTTTELFVDGYDPDSPVPVEVTDIGFPDADSTGAVSGSTTELRVDGTRFNRLVDTRLWYAVGSPDNPPWEAPASWHRVQTDRDDGAVTGTIPLADHDLPTAQPTDPLAVDNTAFDDRPASISIATQVETIDGHRASAVTERAAHVGSAPDNRRVDVGGQLQNATGDPVENATVVATDDEGQVVTTGVPEADGSFVLELPRESQYDLGVTAGQPDEPLSLVPADEIPTATPLETVNATDDRWLGAIELSAPEPLSVTVTDQFGDPVENATVQVDPEGNATPTITGKAADDGVMTFEEANTTLAVAGAVKITVDPPADTDRFAGPVEDQITVGEPTEHAVVLPFESPDVTVTASESTIEAGERLELSVTATTPVEGSLTYRWDLTGDGEIDRRGNATNRSVTLTSPGERTISVTAVDPAGNEATATVTIDVRDQTADDLAAPFDRRGYGPTA